MNRIRILVIVWTISLTFCLSASAEIVVVLFTGFNASTNGDTGMDELNLLLENTDFDGLNYSGDVFQFFEQQQAFDYIAGFDNIDCLVLIGHSFGADSAVELATDFLLPSGIEVDLTVQFDSVGIGDDVLPVNVLHGVNYYQNSTGLFEPEGETNVTAANPNLTTVENYYVESLYGVADGVILHTDIDNARFNYSPAQYKAIFGNQPDLHERIAAEIAAKIEPAFVVGDADGDGILNNLDIAPFVLALTNPVVYQAMFPDVDPEVVLDMNGDGGFDNLDIAGFVAALTS